MASFSERYGYTKPSDIIIRERITPEIQNTICNAFYELLSFTKGDNNYKLYRNMQFSCWTIFFNERIETYNENIKVCVSCITSDKIVWHKKLDLLEFCIDYLKKQDFYSRSYMFFIEYLNCHFERLNFAYRIIDDKIIEISSQEEINVIEEALSDSNSVRVHLQSALQALSIKPDADVRNSIKESISAVEAICRDLTGENTLGRALNCLEQNNIIIPPILKKTFETLYIYTNDGSTGIRHALMDDDSKYIPTKDEAIFMLVACSAFVNYLRKKQIDIK